MSYSTIFKVDTKFNIDIIEMESYFLYEDNTKTNITREMINLKEKSIHEALIKLGWMPPKQEKRIKIKQQEK